MADLTTDFCGIRLDNPVVVGPAGITATAERLRRCEDNGAGAAVMKSYFEHELLRQSPTPHFKVIQRRLGPYRSSTLYSFEQASPYGLQEYAQQIQAAKETCTMPILGSIDCVTPEHWRQAAAACQQAGTDGLELNVSCPHGPHAMTQMTMFEAMIAALDAARQGADRIPLILKVSPQLDNPAATVHRLNAAGTDGVVMFNRLTGLEIDLDSEQPIMHGGYAGHGGPWALHYTLRWISQTYPDLDIPIAASGGVCTGADVAKLLLAGATVVETCSAVVLQGYEYISQLVDELHQFMAKKGYESPSEFRGKICHRIQTNEQIQRARTRVAEIDASQCTACGICATVCIYRAVQQDGEDYGISAALCQGCGLCAELCPIQAIAMIPVP